MNHAKKTIANGVTTSVWVYFDAEQGVAYDAESPPPAVQVSDNARLYTPAEAARLKLPIKGKTTIVPPQPTRCPVCGNPIDQCTCGKDIGNGEEERVPLRGEGPPQQAFQQLLDVCYDQQVERLATLTIRQHGSHRAGADNLRLLGAVLSQVGSNRVRVTLRYNAEFGEGEYISMTSVLDDALYKRLRQTTDSLAREASKFEMNVQVAVEYEHGLDLHGDTFRTLHDLCTTVGLGPLELIATAVEQGTPA